MIRCVNGNTLILLIKFKAMETIGKDKEWQYTPKEKRDGLEAAIKKVKADIEEYQRDGSDTSMLEDHLKSLKKQLSNLES